MKCNPFQRTRCKWQPMATESGIRKVHRNVNLSEIESIRTLSSVLTKERKKTKNVCRQKVKNSEVKQTCYFARHHQQFIEYHSSEIREKAGLDLSVFEQKDKVRIAIHLISFNFLSKRNSGVRWLEAPAAFFPHFVFSPTNSKHSLHSHLSFTSFQSSNERVVLAAKCIVGASNTWDGEQVWIHSFLFIDGSFSDKPIPVESIEYTRFNLFVHCTWKCDAPLTQRKSDFVQLRDLW